VGGPLSEGSLAGEELECPWHGARFNVRTGQATEMPAVEPVATFPVKVENGQVFVLLE
jgi:3-phenylpropionate/trans-cinnamate dioxygenase ferredoxin subunit